MRPNAEFVNCADLGAHHLDSKSNDIQRRVVLVIRASNAQVACFAREAAGDHWRSKWCKLHPREHEDLLVGRRVPEGMGAVIAEAKREAEQAEQRAQQAQAQALAQKAERMRQGRAKNCRYCGGEIEER